MLEDYGFPFDLDYYDQLNLDVKGGGERTDLFRQFEAEYNTICQQRITGTNVVAALKSLLSKIYNSYQDDSLERRDGHLLIAGVYHQFGRIEQDKGNNIAAMDYFLYAGELRQRYNDPNAAFSIFQQFIVAKKTRGTEQEELFYKLSKAYGDSWIEEMLNLLFQNAEIFHSRNEDANQEKDALTMNNIGYMYQTCYFWKERKLVSPDLLPDNFSRLTRWSDGYLLLAIKNYTAGLKTHFSIYRTGVDDKIQDTGSFADDAVENTDNRRILRLIVQTLLQLERCCLYEVKAAPSVESKDVANKWRSGTSIDQLFGILDAVVQILDMVQLKVTLEPERYEELQDVKIDVLYTLLRHWSRGSLLQMSGFEFDQQDDAVIKRMLASLIKLLERWCEVNVLG